jgi:hypothetical protein
MGVAALIMYPRVDVEVERREGQVWRVITIAHQPWLGGIVSIQGRNQGTIRMFATDTPTGDGVGQRHGLSHRLRQAAFVVVDDRGSEAIRSRVRVDIPTEDMGPPQIAAA